MQERPAHLEVSSLSINPEEAPSNDPVDLAGPEFTELSLKQKYYSDGLLFIDQICSAIPILAQLLNSTYKQETLEAMDFFVLAYQYKIEDAIIGVKKMIHLVWTKDNTDEGRSIRKHLVDCIYRIYFTIPLATDSKSTINGIVRNLISLTYKATLADLTSLEELIVAMTEAGHIEPNVVNKLWNVYGHTKTEIPRPQRRGAIIILGMIGHAIPTMISQNIGIMMKIGLGEYGKEDLELTKYTCIALQCIGGTRKRVKGNTNISHSARLPMSDPLFDQLKSILELDNDLVTWFSMAEQIINVIYNLGLRPDILCQEIILIYIEKAKNAQRFDQDKSLSDPWPLSQLIFIVGHVAIKHIVFLEVVESELKKKGANKSKRNANICYID
jgi:condensin complex subunit 1